MARYSLYCNDSSTILHFPIGSAPDSYLTAGGHRHDVADGASGYDVTDRLNRTIRLLESSNIACIGDGSSS
jgi:hypothetical protein